MTDFGYNAQGRLETIRTPLQADAVGASVLTGATDDDTSRTKVAYDGAGRVSSVTLARPVPGAAQPAHSYEYPAEREAKVHVAGLPEPQGFARRLVWEEDPNPWVVSGTTFVRRSGAPTIRRVTETDVNGLASTSVSDWGDRAVSATSPAGRRSGGQYDAASGAHRSGRLTDGWGAGPVACMGEDGTPVAGCGATPAHGAAAYDATWDAATAQRVAWTGLAATWWANPTLSGAPASHSREDARPNLVPSTLPAGVPAGFSARFSGELDVTTAGSHGFGLGLTGYGRLFVDDRLVVDAWSPHPSYAIVSGSAATLSTGRHRIRVDYAAQAGVAPRVEIRWTPPAGSAQAVPNASLAPRYSLLAGTNAFDTTVAVRTVDTAFRTPADGLPTDVVADAAGEKLTTKMTYDALGRLASRALPADHSAASTYAYYGGTEGPVANACNASGAQGGALRSVTAPDRDGDGGQGPRVTEFVYDAVGRVRGSQVVGGGGWSCVSYDARGRVTSQSFPAWDGQAARTATYEYAVLLTPSRRRWPTLRARSPRPSTSWADW